MHVVCSIQTPAHTTAYNMDIFNCTIGEFETIIKRTLYALVISDEITFLFGLWIVSILAKATANLKRCLVHKQRYKNN
jgi:hypothetical protein